VAPTDLNGNNADPTKAPHVIGNSYGCPPDEGCSDNSLLEAVTNVLKAGIFMSVSAGNSGSGCSTITDPPATDKGVCTVGALARSSNTIASYSSRGPIKNLGIGPTLVAPGSSVTSAYPTNRYVALSGTSMASPAITGAIPLLWQSDPTLVRNIENTITRLSQTCQPIPFSACGSSGVPNNVYGAGLLNIYAAVERSSK